MSRIRLTVRQCCRPQITTAAANNLEPSNCDAVGEFASFAPTAAETIVQKAAMMMTLNVFLHIGHVFFY